MKTMTPLSVMMAFLMPSGLMSQIATPALYKQVAPAIVLIATNRGGGTGFIVRSDGVIVTALHVVRDATVVRVSTSSGDVFDQVGLLYEDERKDLALLKIFGFDLPVVKLGNSNNAAVGQSIVVVGNPLATQKLQATLSTGVISGIRDFEEGYNVLQITAAISPGSSGAPILSDDGSVIGVAAFKLLGGESLNFGIPINYVRGFL